MGEQERETSLSATKRLDSLGLSQALSPACSSLLVSSTKDAGGKA